MVCSVGVGVVGGVGEWVAVADSGVEDGGVGLSLSLPLAVVGHGRDESSGAGAETHISTALLLVDSQGGDESGHLVHRTSQVAVGAGHGLVAAHRHRHSVARHHGGRGDGVGQGVGVAQELGSSLAQLEHGSQQHQASHLCAEQNVSDAMMQCCSTTHLVVVQ